MEGEFLGRSDILIPAHAYLSFGIHHPGFGLSLGVEGSSDGGKTLDSNRGGAVFCSIMIANEMKRKQKTTFPGGTKSQKKGG
jgi:hypothetical protein